MQANYTVHSCVAEDVEVDATLPGGQAVKAKVRGVVLELVAADGSSSPTFRYLPADVAAELAKFPPGAAVTVTVAPAA